jgi:Antitoxin Phd_YefM, type II toxin-antitoxin system
MPALETQRNGNTVISALRARANFGKLLQQVEEQRGSLVIEKRGRPRAILLEYPGLCSFSNAGARYFKTAGCRIQKQRKKQTFHEADQCHR